MPRTRLEPRFHVDYLSILDSEGNLDTALEPDLPAADLQRLYRTMVLGRRLDERMVRLQRQGRIGTFAPIKGQEASQLGTVSCLRPADWMVPSFRETAAMIWRGWPIEKLLLFFSGYLEGGQPAPDQHGLPITIPVATQIPHAVGLAYAAQYRGDDVVVMTYFGDGATSEGDFHEALNFAGVWHVPVVFVCQNNQWAISVPVSRQTASETLAQKAVAYGFDGIRVDGNDVFAVLKAVGEAVEKARNGGGPTLVECVTYRMSDHTTADDAGRYRPAEELEMWRSRDPIERLRKYMRSKGIADESYEKNAAAKINKQVEGNVREAEAVLAPNPSDIFDFMYEKMPRGLAEQKNSLLAGGETK